jgi:hypothetical protein
MFTSPKELVLGGIEGDGLKRKTVHGKVRLIHPFPLCFLTYCLFSFFTAGFVLVGVAFFSLTDVA